MKSRGIYKMTDMTAFVGSLGSTGLMALMVVVLAGIVKKFYEKAEEDRKSHMAKIHNNISELNSKLEESNNLASTQIKVLEAQSEFFKQLHEKEIQETRNRIDAVNSNINETLAKTEKPLQTLDNSLKSVKQDTELIKKIGHANYKTIQEVKQISKGYNEIQKP